MDVNALSDDDYKTIEQAVMETARGRWFLAEFARRNRNADTDQVLASIEKLEQSFLAKQATPTVPDDVALTQTISQGEADAVDRVRYGILEMADAIARTKAEIAAIRADGDDLGRFEEASVELDAIVDQTEKATSSILASAEMVQEVAWTLREMNVDSEACDILDSKATEIYTACSFQDLTGQRTRKVIHVLRYLEQRVNAMGAIWTGQDPSDVPVPPPPPHLPQAHRGPDGHLLNGPALPGHGLVQDDVDAMLGGAEKSAPPPVDPISEEEHIAHLRQKVEDMRALAYGAGATVHDSDEEDLEDFDTEGETLTRPQSMAEVVAAEAVKVTTPVATAPSLRVKGLADPQEIEKLNYVEKLALFS